MSVTLQIKSHIVVRLLQKEETEKAFTSLNLSFWEKKLYIAASFKTAKCH